MYKNLEQLLAARELTEVPLTIEAIREAMNKDREELVTDGNSEFVRRFDDLRKCTDIQCSSGNYDCNEYMYGMANGLILALHIMQGSLDTNVPYMEKPAKWIDSNTSATPVSGTQRKLGDGTAAHVR